MKIGCLVCITIVNDTSKTKLYQPINYELPVFKIQTSSIMGTYPHNWSPRKIMKTA